MKKRKINKKGISPMIATVLLIGFVISIILLILLWGKDYIEELAEKRGALAEKQQECTKIQFDVLKACWRGSAEIDVGTEAEIVLRNKVDVDIHKFIFRAVGGIGEPIERYGKNAKLGGLETKEYKNLQFAEADVKNIDVIPHLKVALGHYVPCSKQKITVRLTGCQKKDLYSR